MLSFVWSARNPFLVGRGGSENYTAGQVRELMRRGIPTRIITIGFGEDDGREGFPDITFTAFDSMEQLSELDDILVGVTYPVTVPTKHPSFTILHCALSTYEGRDKRFDLEKMHLSHLVAPSKFAARTWANTLHMRPHRIPAVYPFAEDCFGQVERPDLPGDKINVLFAGRLTPDKGIYTLLAALHMESLAGLDFAVTATDAAGDTECGPIIRALLEAHPLVNVVPARRSPQEMAKLMAEHDIVVMPSTDIFWKENFGIVAVEAQHAGCRVVASNCGGIPETDCGGLVLVRPDDPQALAGGIARAAALGPLTIAERMYASSKFTVAQSVDTLLKIIAETHKQKHSQLPLLQKQGALVREQLDLAFGTINELGRRLARDN